MTLLIAILLMYLIGVTSPSAYLLVGLLWIGHVIWHSSKTNKGL